MCVFVCTVIDYSALLIEYRALFARKKGHSVAKSHSEVLPKINKKPLRGPSKKGQSVALLATKKDHLVAHIVPSASH